MKKNETLSLIRDIYQKRKPANFHEIEGASSIGELPRQLRLEIMDMLNDEFCETGLGENDEPNEYGLSIEAAIDELNFDIAD
ncbi:MAG: hypothetical protein H6624_09565 [Bdellovibrionaceae bacterium]|nr:hypothetical protein [Bdellovibrionales bacterium]MCB9084583.1 hypothetical protein [Pseudobdellovibrionaceae bacterium]